MNRIVIVLASVVLGTKGAELPISVTQVAKTFLKATVGFIRLT